MSQLFLRQWAFIFLFTAPPSVILIWISARKKVLTAELREPFTTQPLRSAGESARAKADDLLYDATTYVMILFVCGIFAGISCSYVPAGQLKMNLRVLFGLDLLFTVYCGRRAWINLRKSWDYKLGAKGEQWVGRELDQLLACGYKVFHDLQFDGWNIDHVAVGPDGIFAIETKTWRKKFKKPKQQKMEIGFDGNYLTRPGCNPDNAPIDQAIANASSLEKLIGVAAAERVTVVPVLAFPGWFINTKSSGKVVVLSGTNMSQNLPRFGRCRLTFAQILRISHQVAQKCGQQTP